MAAARSSGSPQGVLSPRAPPPASDVAWLASIVRDAAADSDDSRSPFHRNRAMDYLRSSGVLDAALQANGSLVDLIGQFVALDMNWAREADERRRAAGGAGEEAVPVLEASSGDDVAAASRSPPLAGVAAAAAAVSVSPLVAAVADESVRESLAERARNPPVPVPLMSDSPLPEVFRAAWTRAIEIAEGRGDESVPSRLRIASGPAEQMRQARRMLAEYTGMLMMAGGNDPSAQERRRADSLNVRVFNECVLLLATLARRAIVNEEKGDIGEVVRPARVAIAWYTHPINPRREVELGPHRIAYGNMFGVQWIRASCVDGTFSVFPAAPNDRAIVLRVRGEAPNVRAGVLKLIEQNRNFSLFALFEIPDSFSVSQQSAARIANQNTPHYAIPRLYARVDRAIAGEFGVVFPDLRRTDELQGLVAITVDMEPIIETARGDLGALLPPGRATSQQSAASASALDLSDLARRLNLVATGSQMRAQALARDSAVGALPLRPSPIPPSAAAFGGESKLPPSSSSSMDTAGDEAHRSHESQSIRMRRAYPLGPGGQIEEAMDIMQEIREIVLRHVRMALPYGQISAQRFQALRNAENAALDEAVEALGAMSLHNAQLALAMHRALTRIVGAIERLVVDPEQRPDSLVDMRNSLNAIHEHGDADAKVDLDRSSAIFVEDIGRISRDALGRLTTAVGRVIGRVGRAAAGPQESKSDQPFAVCAKKAAADLDRVFGGDLDLTNSSLRTLRSATDKLKGLLLQGSESKASPMRDDVDAVDLVREIAKELDQCATRGSEVLAELSKGLRDLESESGILGDDAPQDAEMGLSVAAAAAAPVARNIGTGWDKSLYSASRRAADSMVAVKIQLSRIARVVTTVYDSIRRDKNVLALFEEADRKDFFGNDLEAEVERTIAMEANEVMNLLTAGEQGSPPRAEAVRRVGARDGGKHLMMVWVVNRRISRMSRAIGASLEQLQTLAGEYAAVETSVVPDDKTEQSWGLRDDQLALAERLRRFSVHVVPRLQALAYVLDLYSESDKNRCSAMVAQLEAKDPWMRVVPDGLVRLVKGFSASETVESMRQNRKYQGVRLFDGRISEIVKWQTLCKGAIEHAEFYFGRIAGWKRVVYAKLMSGSGRGRNGDDDEDVPKPAARTPEYAEMLRRHQIEEPKPAAGGRENRPGADFSGLVVETDRAFGYAADAVGSIDYSKRGLLVMGRLLDLSWSALQSMLMAFASMSDVVVLSRVQRDPEAAAGGMMAQQRAAAAAAEEADEDGGGMPDLEKALVDSFGVDASGFVAATMRSGLLAAQPPPAEGGVRSAKYEDNWHRMRAASYVAVQQMLRSFKDFSAADVVPKDTAERQSLELKRMLSVEMKNWARLDLGDVLVNPGTLLGTKLSAGVTSRFIEQLKLLGIREMSEAAESKQRRGGGGLLLLPPPPVGGPLETYVEYAFGRLGSPSLEEIAADVASAWRSDPQRPRQVADVRIGELTFSQIAKQIMATGNDSLWVARQLFKLNQLYLSHASSASKRFSNIQNELASALRASEYALSKGLAVEATRGILATIGGIVERGKKQQSQTDVLEIVRREIQRIKSEVDGRVKEMKRMAEQLGDAVSLSAAGAPVESLRLAKESGAKALQLLAADIDRIPADVRDEIAAVSRTAEARLLLVAKVAQRAAVGESSGEFLSRMMAEMLHSALFTLRLISQPWSHVDPERQLRAEVARRGGGGANGMVEIHVHAPRDAQYIPQSPDVVWRVVVAQAQKLASWTEYLRLVDDVWGPEIAEVMGNNPDLFSEESSDGVLKRAARIVRLGRPFDSASALLQRMRQIAEQFVPRDISASPSPAKGGKSGSSAAAAAVGGGDRVGSAVEMAMQDFWRTVADKFQRVVVERGYDYDTEQAAIERLISLIEANTSPNEKAKLSREKLSKLNLPQLANVLHGVSARRKEEERAAAAIDLRVKELQQSVAGGAVGSELDAMFLALLGEYKDKGSVSPVDVADDDDGGGDDDTKARYARYKEMLHEFLAFFSKVAGHCGFIALPLEPPREIARAGKDDAYRSSLRIFSEVRREDANLLVRRLPFFQDMTTRAPSRAMKAALRIMRETAAAAGGGGGALSRTHHPSSSAKSKKSREGTGKRRIRWSAEERGVESVDFGDPAEYAQEFYAVEAIGKYLRYALRMYGVDERGPVFKLVAALVSVFRAGGVDSDEPSVQEAMRTIETYRQEVVRLEAGVFADVAAEDIERAAREPIRIDDDRDAVSRITRAGANLNPDGSVRIADPRGGAPVAAAAAADGDVFSRALAALAVMTPSQENALRTREKIVLILSSLAGLDEPFVLAWRRSLLAIDRFFARGVGVVGGDGEESRDDEKASESRASPPPEAAAGGEGRGRRDMIEASRLYSVLLERIMRLLRAMAAAWESSGGPRLIGSDRVAGRGGDDDLLAQLLPKPVADAAGSSESGSEEVRAAVPPPASAASAASDVLKGLEVAPAAASDGKTGDAGDDGQEDAATMRVTLENVLLAMVDLDKNYHLLLEDIGAGAVSKALLYVNSFNNLAGTTLTHAIHSRTFSPFFQQVVYLFVLRALYARPGSKATPDQRAELEKNFFAMKTTLKCYKIDRRVVENVHVQDSAFAGSDAFAYMSPGPLYR